MTRSEFLAQRNAAYSKADHEAAAKLEEAWLREAPHDHDAWMRAGYTLTALGRQDEAFAKLREAARLQPWNGRYRSMAARAGEVCPRELAQLEAELGSSDEAYARREHQVIEEQILHITDIVETVLSSWSHAVPGGAEFTMAETLRGFPVDEGVGAEWARRNPPRHREGDLVDFGPLGHLYCGDPEQVIFKRVARGIPWEAPLAVTLAELARRMKPDSIVLDVGANAGTITVPLARHAPGAVVAFEPVPSTFAALEKNIEANALGNVEARREACSDTAGTGYMVDIHSTNPGMAKLGESEDGMPTPMVRLDEVVGDRSVGLIKIDVEGHEVSALKGAERILERCCPVIAAEVLSRSGGELVHYLKSHGYTAHRLIREDYVFVPA